MNQSTGQRIRRGMNFLSMLGAKLRDLQETATLAHELIQNAEDAVGRIDEPEGQAATMTFRIDEKVLIVENEGIFSDCGDPHRQPCVWDTPCDFHGFTDVGSGRKRLEEKQKGAFGFGFTAVYQMTGHPEVISSGRHWILEDDKPEDQRILECVGCNDCQGRNLPGTRFILPWAYDLTITHVSASLISAGLVPAESQLTSYQNVMSYSLSAGLVPAEVTMHARYVAASAGASPTESPW